MYKKKLVVLYCFQMDCFDVSKLVTLGDSPTTKITPV